MQRPHSDAHGSVLRRSAIANAPLFDDPMHQPMIDQRRREEGLHRGMRGGPSDAFLKYSCPSPGKVLTQRTATIKPVRIAKADGSDPTNAPDLSVAQSIFRRCCVSLNVQPVTTIRKPAWQNIDSKGSGTPPTDEAADLGMDVNEDDKITVVSIRNWDVNGTLKTDVHGGAVTLAYGTNFPVVIAVDSIVPEIIAHEVGHGLGYLTHDAAAAGTIMEATNSATKPNPRHVNEAVCRGVRSGPVVFPTGSICCQELK
jgi:hypothetical protein